MAHQGESAFHIEWKKAKAEEVDLDQTGAVRSVLVKPNQDVSTKYKLS